MTEKNLEFESRGFYQDKNRLCNNKIKKSFFDNVEERSKPVRWVSEGL